MKNNIDLSGDRYEWLGNIFYIAYIIFQHAELEYIQATSTGDLLSFVTGVWASTPQAAAFNWQGLMACRLFLGWAETMFGPGLHLYLSFFYPNERIGKRFGVILAGSALANTYGSALAFGLGTVHSKISTGVFCSL